MNRWFQSGLLISSFLTDVAHHLALIIFQYFQGGDQCFAYFGITFPVLHTQLGLGITVAWRSRLRPYSSAYGSRQQVTVIGLLNFGLLFWPSVTLRK